MSRNRISGFTLIELMVVIVIIGVLASLAIPRFSEASAKAKMSEAPVVLKSYESGVLAATVESSAADLEGLTFKDIVMDPPKDSKWWDYKTENTDDKKVTTTAFTAKAAGKMGSFAEGKNLNTKLNTGGDDNCFDHASDSEDAAKKMVPQFMTSGCVAVK